MDIAEFINCCTFRFLIVCVSMVINKVNGMYNGSVERGFAGTDFGVGR
jgi:hypothetical protein